jgi:translation initiation factor SUI1
MGSENFTTVSRMNAFTDMDILGGNSAAAVIDLSSLDKTRVDKIHIRTQQMGKKWITTIDGLDDDLDQKKIAKHLQKDLHCSAKVSKNKDDKDVITLQGDQRALLRDWLVTNEVLTAEEGKIRLTVH